MNTTTKIIAPRTTLLFSRPRSTCLSKIESHKAKLKNTLEIIQALPKFAFCNIDSEVVYAAVKIVSWGAANHDRTPPAETQSNQTLNGRALMLNRIVPARMPGSRMILLW